MSKNIVFCHSELVEGGRMGLTKNCQNFANRMGLSTKTPFFAALEVCNCELLLVNNVGAV